MKQKSGTRSWYVGLILLIAVTVLAGCGGQAPVGTVDTADAANIDSNAVSTDAALDTSYPDALDVSGQLALGTMRLEEGEHAVTSEQALALLSLWQIVQGGGLQGDAEINAVLSQIEGQMTPGQLTAIAAMQLVQGDLKAWAQEHGMSMGVRNAPGQMGSGQDLTEEQQAERKAQGGGAASGPPAGAGELSEEERAAMRATMEASGEMPAGAGLEPFVVLLNPLVELLTQRAAE